MELFQCSTKVFRKSVPQMSSANLFHKSVPLRERRVSRQSITPLRGYERVCDPRCIYSTYSTCYIYAWNVLADFCVLPSWLGLLLLRYTLLNLASPLLCAYASKHDSLLILFLSFLCRCVFTLLVNVLSMFLSVCYHLGCHPYLSFLSVQLSSILEIFIAVLHRLLLSDHHGVVFINSFITCIHQFLHQLLHHLHSSIPSSIPSPPGFITLLAFTCSSQCLSLTSHLSHLSHLSPKLPEPQCVWGIFLPPRPPSYIATWFSVTFGCGHI